MSDCHSMGCPAHPRRNLAGRRQGLFAGFGVQVLLTVQPPRAVDGVALRPQTLRGDLSCTTLSVRSSCVPVCEGFSQAADWLHTSFVPSLGDI
jgi:hypothetical protein